MRAHLYSLCVWILVISGAFIASLGGYDYWQSQHAQREIAQQWQEDEIPASSVDPSTKSDGRKSSVPTPAARHRGSAVAKLTIPRLDTTLYVVEGTDEDDLKRGPGHLAGSVLPGVDGNCVIAGHRDTHFRALRNIEKGDEIVLERNGKDYRYRVDEMSVVSPDNTDSLQPTSEAVLNLITCFPFEYVGSAPKRFIVHADLEKSSLSASR